MQMLKVNGIKIGSFRSLKEAKRIAQMYKGKGKITVCELKQTAIPHAAMLAYNSPKSLKREIYREIYSETNHGYHMTWR